MDKNNFSIKTQEILQSAILFAAANGNKLVEPSHILKAMLTTDDSLTKRLLTELGANTSRIEDSLNLFVSSSDTTPNERPLSKSTINILNSAEKHISVFGDKYVEVEHILLGILDVIGKVPQLLRNEGITKVNLIKSIKKTRS